MLSRDGALTPDQIAESVWEGLSGEEFLILPHPKVADYYRSRAAHTDKWLASMNKIQLRLES